MMATSPTAEEASENVLECDLSTERGIITALGGSRAVAERLGCLQTSVANWSRVGISRFQWLGIVTLAQERGLDVTYQHLDQLWKARGLQVSRPGKAKGKKAGKAKRRRQPELT